MSQNGAHVQKKNRAGKSRGKKTLKNVLIVLAVLILALGIGGYFAFHHLYGLMNTGNNSPTASPAAELTVSPAPTEEPEDSPEPTETPEPTPEPLTEEELQALAELELRQSLEADAEEIMYNQNVYNILLIGADGVKDTLERSDAMILLSINRETKKIWVTSLMRDTQVSIPGWGTGHLNWATSYGASARDATRFDGVNLLISTLESEKNFAIHIDNWALVNFLDFAEVANLLGPITVTVTAEEAAGMNALIRQVCQMRDKKLGIKKTNPTYRSFFPAEGGTVTITDGIQILAYCRERHTYVAGHYGDTGRSNKQREVLLAMWENVKKMNIFQQYELAETVMSIVTTDLTEGQCFSLLLSAPSFLTYQVYGQQIPNADAMTKGRDANGLSTYFADFRVNRNILRATVYGEEVSAYDLHSSFTGITVTLPDA